MPKGIKGFQLNHEVSIETRFKIGNANRRAIFFLCDQCGKVSFTKLSSYKRKQKHFCSNECYVIYRRDSILKEEHNAFGHGFPIEERIKRKKARSILNHAIRDGKVIRGNCIFCGIIAEAHHDDYSKALNVKWLCSNHHPKILDLVK